MQQERLEARKRDSFGKGNTRALRRSGGLPAILYGRGQDVLPLELEENIFRLFLRAHGENVLINMEIAGHGTETVMIREIQRDSAVKRILLHADFMRISLDEPVTAAVPVVLVGSSPGIREGGVLEFPLREVQLHCLPTLLPNELEVDISEMDINDMFHVGGLELAEEITVLDDAQTMIVAISPPRIFEEEEAAEEAVEGEEVETDEEEAPTEPELISRRRRDDDDEE